MITRLRPLPTPEQLQAMYPKPHDHTIYGMGHDMRVRMTIAMAVGRMGGDPPANIADLSCGNGVIARSISKGFGGTAPVILGDFAAGYEHQGPIEQTIHQIPNVDVFVLSETLEHVDDPGQVLRDIRAKAHRLVLSTPIECWDDGNGEHLWAWDREGVEQLMIEASWLPQVFVSLDSRTFREPYLYGMWVAS